jgi:hypothetical protein
VEEMATPWRLTARWQKGNNVNDFRLKMAKARSGFRTWLAIFVPNRSTAVSVLRFLFCVSCFVFCVLCSGFRVYGSGFRF